MKSEYIPPLFKGESFHCPHCGVFAHQHWYEVNLEDDSEDKSSPEILHVSACEKCDMLSLWIDEKIIYPFSGKTPAPVNDMPEEVKKDYLEARSILDRSPKSATALLRLAMQNLIFYLSKGENLDQNLRNLRRRGLDAKFQKALESVRMTGEKAVNPGQIAQEDNSETALVLFNLLNLIVDALITQPRMVNDILENLSDKKK
jgi:hypothetical protein